VLLVALIVVLDHDGLLASVTASKHDHDLAGLDAVSQTQNSACNELLFWIAWQRAARALHV